MLIILILLADGLLAHMILCGLNTLLYVSRSSQGGYVQNVIFGRLTYPVNYSRFSLSVANTVGYGGLAQAVSVSDHSTTGFLYDADKVTNIRWLSFGE